MNKCNERAFIMAGKRGATSDLNHDNWDQEEEREEAGAWKEATKDVLKDRVIRKAKRKGITKTVRASFQPSEWLYIKPLIARRLPKHVRTP